MFCYIKLARKKRRTDYTPQLHTLRFPYTRFLTPFSSFMQLVRTDVQSTRLTFPHRLVLRFQHTLLRFLSVFVCNTRFLVFCASSFSTHTASFSVRLRFQHTLLRFLCDFVSNTRFLSRRLFVGMGLLPPFSTHALRFQIQSCSPFLPMAVRRKSRNQASTTRHTSGIGAGSHPV